jgi:hypothetical protein
MGPSLTSIDFDIPVLTRGIRTRKSALHLSATKNFFLSLIHMYVSMYHEQRSRDSSVGIATPYGLDGTMIKSWRGKDFPHPSISAMGPTQPPIKWILGIFPGSKAVKAWYKYQLHPAPRLKKEYSCTSTPLLGVRGLFEGEIYLLIFYQEQRGLNNFNVWHSVHFRIWL